MTAVALVAASVLACAAAGLLAYEGFLGAEPARYVVTGTVYQPGGGLLTPMAGATVVLSSNGVIVATNTTGLAGTFIFRNVAAGGIELNVTAVGYAPTVVYTFASPSYSTQTRGLNIEIEPGSANNTSVAALTPFGDLETFLAYIGGATVLLVGAAGAAGAAAFAVRRPLGGVAGVIGAGAAVAVPVVLVLLYVGTLFPTVTAVAGAAGGAGGFALVLATTSVASRTVSPAAG